METSFGFTVRSKGDDKREYRGEKVWWRGQKQRVNLGHPKGCNHGRDELGDCASSSLGDDDERQQIELVIGGSGSEALEQRHGLLVPDSGVLFKSVNRDCLFPEREPSRPVAQENVTIQVYLSVRVHLSSCLRSRVVGQNEHRDEGCENGNSSFQDEQPSDNAVVQIPSFWC